jgi:dTDP-4-amino-4,6-dideoxygalactose transaminase
MTSTASVPFFGLDRQYAQLREQLLAASDRVYRTGQVLDGFYTQAFEQAVALRCNRRYAVAVNSATNGLVYAMQCIPYDPDNPPCMAVPALSFPATLNAALTTDLEVKITDVTYSGLINLGSLNGTLEQENIQAIMYVNLFGNTVDWDKFQLETEFFNQHNPWIIEDAAQSFGASSRGVPSGKMGHVSVLSFDPTKNLPNYGSGGMVLTDNPDTALIIRNLRDNCKLSNHDYVGYNSKMSESDCAQMLVKLEYFDGWQQRRAKIAAYYSEHLSGLVSTPGITHGTVPAWHKYVIRTAHRNSLQQHLKDLGVETRIHYERPLYDLEIGSASGPSPLESEHWEAARFCNECISLPIYPELTDSQIEYVVNQVRDFF